MIFGPDLIRLIRARRKTQTRREVNGRAHCLYVPGRAYALQPGRGKRGEGQITVEHVRDELLGEISYADARREGFRTTGDFKAYWIDLHGEFDPELRVWVITFTLGDATYRPRLLVARTGTSLGDYTDITSKSMNHEGEAVGDRELKRYAREAQERRTGEQRERWRDQRRRLLEVVREVRGTLPAGVKDDELRGLERQVESLNRKMKARSAPGA